MLTNKELLGLINEKVLLTVLISLFKVKDDFRIKHNDFKNYHDGISRGVDFRIFERNRSLYDIEVKNWKLFNKPYGLDVAEKEIVERFSHSCAMFKILIISFAQLLSQPALRLLRSHNIHVFSVDRLLGKSVFKSQFFYTLKARLKAFLKSLTTKPEAPDFGYVGYYNLTTTNDVDVTTTNCDISNYNTVTKQTHDTPSLIEQQTEPEFDYAVWLLKEAIRYHQWIQSLKEHGIRIEA